MSRYDWSKAPSWARFAATDNDGRVYWYQSQPHKLGDQWQPGIGLFIEMGHVDDWWDTLESRPTEIDTEWPDALERSIPPLEMSA